MKPIELNTQVIAQCPYCHVLMDMPTHILTINGKSSCLRPKCIRKLIQDACGEEAHRVNAILSAFGGNL